jgi:hypothetical protein
MPRLAIRHRQVVDEQFFDKLGKMEEIPVPSDISNCDIVWFMMGSMKVKIRSECNRPYMFDNS